MMLEMLDGLRRTRALAQMHDIYPTVVEAMGGKVSPGRIAVSLLPVASGKADSVRKLAISEIGDRPPLGLMARDARFKYWEDGDGTHLFDLEEDPFEMKDLGDSPEHQEALHQMRHRLLTHLRSTQVNFAEGYKNKVQRLREAEAVRKERMGPPQPEGILVAGNGTSFLSFFK